MKVRELLAQLNALVEKDPAVLEDEVVQAADPEGNSYSVVNTIDEMWARPDGYSGGRTRDLEVYDSADTEYEREERDFRAVVIWPN